MVTNGAVRSHETEAKTAFEGGATRSQKSERFDLIPAEAELATARRFGLGAAKHGDRNWQNGGAEFILATINHLQAHLNSIKRGSPSNDDDIGAVLCNASMLAWFRQRKAGEFCKAMDEIAGGQDEVMRAILTIPATGSILENPDIFNKVREILIDQLGCDAALYSETKLTDLGADSLDSIELLMAFEETFDFEMSEDAVPEDITVGGIVEYLSKLPRKLAPADYPAEYRRI